ncbi:MAG: hypothetical protein LBH55_00195 [Mycoplasmataceae bacterium]|nr:hypothetical protein [Mycoplasmataceae bacterium]
MKPLLLQELKNQYGQYEDSDFYDINQIDIEEIDLVNQTATVVAKDFATVYKPNSTTQITWKVDNLIELPKTITLPKLWDTGFYAQNNGMTDAEVFKLMSQSPCTKALNFSELTIDSYNSKNGILKLIPKPTSTIYKLNTETDILVNRCASIEFSYSNKSISSGVTTAAPTFKYRGSAVAATYSIVSNPNTSIFSIGTTTGKVTYASGSPFDGGNITIAAKYTVSEIIDTITKEKQDFEYVSYFDIMATQTPSSFLVKGSFETSGAVKFDNTNLPFDIPKGYYIETNWIQYYADTGSKYSLLNNPLIKSPWVNSSTTTDFPAFKHSGNATVNGKSYKITTDLNTNFSFDDNYSKIKIVADIVWNENNYLVLPFTTKIKIKVNNNISKTTAKNLTLFNFAKYAGAAGAIPTSINLATKTKIPNIYFEIHA